MDNQNKEDLFKLLNWLGGVYSKSIDDELVEAYLIALEGVNKDLIAKAVKAHIKDPNQGSFFPKPADIIRQAVSISVPTIEEVAATISNRYGSISNYSPFEYAIYQRVDVWNIRQSSAEMAIKKIRPVYNQAVEAMLKGREFERPPVEIENKKPKQESLKESDPEAAKRRIAELRKMLDID